MQATTKHGNHIALNALRLAAQQRLNSVSVLLSRIPAVSSPAEAYAAEHLRHNAEAEARSIEAALQRADLNMREPPQRASFASCHASLPCHRSQWTKQLLPLC